MLTLALMGLTTGLIALLPGYARLGAISPVLLVLLRFLQGIALGGEWAGALLLTAEQNSETAMGMGATWSQLGPGLGTVLSAGVIWGVTRSMDAASFQDWGWRLPLFLSLLLLAAGWVVRSSLSEPPQFAERKARGEVLANPVGAVLRHHGRSLLIAASTRIGPDVLYALLTVFSLSYVTQTGELTRSAALMAVFAGSAWGVIVTLLAGRFSNCWGAKRIFLVGTVCGFPSGAPAGLRDLSWAFGSRHHVFGSGRAHQPAVSGRGPLFRLFDRLYLRQPCGGRGFCAAHHGDAVQGDASRTVDFSLCGCGTSGFRCGRDAGPRDALSVSD